METQVSLFSWADPRPLKKLLLPERLRAVPRAPGVYWFVGFRTGRRGLHILYVGKAINLRRRLAEYRAAPVSRLPSLLAGCVDDVREVRWQVCHNHAEAVLLEAELLQLYRPPGNQRGTHPNSRWFAGLRVQGTQLSLLRSGVPHPGYEWFGAFSRRSAFAALVRCLWRATPQTAGVFDWPLGFWNRPGPGSVCFRFPKDSLGEAEVQRWRDRLRRFWSGEANDLLDWLRQQADTWTGAQAWKQWGFESDCAVLDVFFRRVAGPLRELRARHGITETWWEAGEVEKWQALSQLDADPQRGMGPGLRLAASPPAEDLWG